MTDLIFNGDSLRGIINDAQDIKYELFDFFYSYFSNLANSDSTLVPNWSTMTETERKEYVRNVYEANQNVSGVNNVKDALDTLFHQLSEALGEVERLEGVVNELSSRSRILTQTLAVGATSVTFTNVPVDKNYIIDFFTSRPMDYEEIDDSLYQSQQKITVIFPENTTGAAVQVYCRLEAIT